MMASRNCVLLLMAGLVLCSAQSSPPEIVTHAPTTSSPATSETTVAPTTTTMAPTTTTTVEPTTTTAATTTPTPTTTTAPTTTSTEPPKPTTPAPVPDPEVGSWVFTNKTTNQTCVLTQMALQLNVTYLDASDKPVHTLYDVPKDAKVVNGSCLADSQFIVLSWGPPSVKDNTLMVSFKVNATVHEFSLSGLHFSLVIFGDEFPNAKDNQTITLVNDQIMFHTPLDMSYHCNRPQQLNLTSVDPAGLNSTLTVSKLQFEAFHTKHNAKFSIAKDCDAIDTPDIVPIAVGCALILLIVIVLIAYLAGRRSTRSRGYVSM
ncbi:lysosome-associated membrane glycoprotein 1-like [Toxorhynchites rutilus septentrionalis]|uniref:lysosome-associated membrane glycoprotein 1-like n=1 Tax=Toxorhynchites rutilus septentrionalis TaxID=329112 RepID=UPI00247A5153|nr:lysosome-associated membrane glycoprotein 1-like [Toxorhynchites rutilus septentrionalis]